MLPRTGEGKHKNHCQAGVGHIKKTYTFGSAAQSREEADKREFQASPGRPGGKRHCCIGPKTISN